MRSLFVLFAILLAHSEARLQLSRQSYMKLPYQFTNGDPTNPRYGLFQNAAHKAAFHTVDKILYVACKLFSIANVLQRYRVLCYISFLQCMYLSFKYSCAINREIPPHY